MVHSCLRLAPQREGDGPAAQRLAFSLAGQDIFELDVTQQVPRLGDEIEDRLVTQADVALDHDFRIGASACSASATASGTSPSFSFDSSGAAGSVSTIVSAASSETSGNGSITVGSASSLVAPGRRASRAAQRRQSDEDQRGEARGGGVDASGVEHGASLEKRAADCTVPSVTVFASQEARRQRRSNHRNDMQESPASILAISDTGSGTTLNPRAASRS